jgi:hypothetical protein
VGILIENIKDCFPHDEENGNGWGWDLPKIHAFDNMPQNMLKFGTRRNFSGQIGERVLKTNVKDCAVKTQQRPDKFVDQCTITECEVRQLDFIIKDVFIQFGINSKNECTNTSKFQPQGKFTASFGGMNGQSMMPVCITGTIMRKRTKWAFQFQTDSNSVFNPQQNVLGSKKSSWSQATPLSKFMRKIVCNL